MSKNIVEQRAEHYGDGDENLTRIAALWSAWLGTEVTVHDVCWMMTMVKASRSKVDPAYGDNYVDAHGYIELGERFG